MQEKPLNCALTDPPKPWKPTYTNTKEKCSGESAVELWDRIYKETEIDSRKQWAKKIAESLGVCSDPEGTCADCVINQCPGRPGEKCADILKKHAKIIIEKYILDSEEKND